MVVTLSNIEGLRISGKTGKVAMLNFDGKKGVTVQDVIDALYDVGKEFNNAAKGKDSKSLVSNEELLSIFERNPRSLAGLKILDGSKVFLVSVGADGKGKIEEEKTIIAPKKEAEIKHSETSKEPSFIAPSHPSTSEIVAPFDTKAALVEKHLARFKLLTGIADDTLARTCLSEILKDDKASMDTINKVISDVLKRGFSFNDRSFAAFGIDDKSGQTLSPDQFLSNLETTIIDMNHAESAPPAKLIEYAEHRNFYVVRTDSDFGRANISTFKDSALKVLKDNKIPISDNADLAEIIKKLDAMTNSGNDTKISFFKNIAENIKLQLKNEGIDLNSVDEKDARKKDELNRNIEKLINVSIGSRLFGMMPNLLTGLDRMLGTTNERGFKSLYDAANQRKDIYESAVKKYVESGGEVFDMKGLRPGIFDGLSDWWSGLFDKNSGNVPQPVGEGNITVPAQKPDGGRL